MLNAVQSLQSSPLLHVFYASQSGNGEEIAERIGRSGEQAGLSLKVQSVSQLKPALLRKIEYAVFIVSTHGEGDPPDDALDLFDFLRAERTPRLGGLRFRVLALGDSSYLRFCEAGRKLERLLMAQGAQPFAPRVECDLDFRQAANAFEGEVVEFGREQGIELSPSGASATGPSTPDLRIVRDEPLWRKERPFPALVESVSGLTTADSVKDTRHVVLSLAGSGIRYAPGDSLGVFAPNDPELVQAILQSLRLDPAEKVELDGISRSVRDWLTSHREITRLAPSILESWARLARGPGLRVRLASFDTERLRRFMEQRQLIDLVQEFPAKVTATELLDLLRPLAPRSYSIASSQAAVDDEVHLTVVTHGSNSLGVERQGVASGHLNGRLQAGDSVQVFPEPNKRFRLPENPSTPLILIAAGTGVAPYRAFLQQLEEQGSTARSWLIFGSPNQRRDFLYQSEWLGWRSSGLLERIDTAFSRDQEDKRYVQHVVKEQAGRLCEWLDWGAHVYICGALSMGHEVETAISEALVEQRGLTADEAASRIATLRRDKRLLKDLY